jgi:hypothetical protein
MAMIVYPSGNKKEVPDSFINDLEAQQVIVGGYVTYVYVDDEIIICDEEGECKELPFNRFASLLAGQPISGTVIICDKGIVE